MDALILATRYGKSRQITAKLFACMIFTTAVIGGMFLLFCIAFGVRYGILGWNADIQTNFGLSLMEADLSLNNLQLILFGFGIVWLAGIFTAAVTAMISSLTRSPFSSFILAFAVFIAPWVIRRLLPESILRDLMIVFPANAINAHEILLMSVNAQSIFCSQPFAPVLYLCFTAMTIILISSVIAYKFFVTVQPSG